MPWSPIPKFPEIILELKKRGYIKETTTEELRIAIMRKTGLIKDKTIKQTIQAMEDLEFIKLSTTGRTWIIEPQKQDIIKEEEKNIDKILE